MKKYALTLLALLTLIPALSFAGTDIQNGGGGLIVNGKVATFYSAKISIDPEPLAAFAEISQLNKVIYHLNFDAKAKMMMLKNVAPSIERQYFKATESNTKDVLEQIKIEYQKVTGLDINQITLFAITNPRTNKTVLLPDFFKLNSTEKMAILFHESMWLSDYPITLQQMLKLEYVFQQFLEDRNPRNTFLFYHQLGSLLQKKDWLVKSVFIEEIFDYLKTHAEYPTLSDVLSFESIMHLSRFFISDYSYELGRKDEVVSEFISSLIIGENDNDSFAYTKKALILTFPERFPSYHDCILPEEVKDQIAFKNTQRASEVLGNQMSSSSMFDLSKMKFYSADGSILIDCSVN